MTPTGLSRLVRVGALLALTGPLFITADASAERIVASGFYTEAGAGATTYLGDAANYSRIGPAFDLRMGYDVFRWFSLGVHLGASTHEATVPPPPEGEYYQLYAAGADARLELLVGPVGLFVDGGLGAGMVSSNILQKVAILEPGERFTLMFRAGGGVEYQLVNRHYAFGLAGQWMLMPQFGDAGVQGVATRLYLRYTY